MEHDRLADDRRSMIVARRSTATRRQSTADVRMSDGTRDGTNAQRARAPRAATEFVPQHTAIGTAPRPSSYQLARAGGGGVGWGGGGDAPALRTLRPCLGRPEDAQDSRRRRRYRRRRRTGVEHRVEVAVFRHSHRQQTAASIDHDIATHTGLWVHQLAFWHSAE